ncbi:MAG: ATP-binding protein [Lachnospiraceae bacterium]|nr:ATP-binding protein [Lachnospiraceae bacterium]
MAASMLMVVVRMAAGFVSSFLSCLELIFLHVIKKIPEPFSKEWVIGLISGAGYCFAILAVRWMSKHLEPVFCGKPRKWYVILAFPLLVIIMVYDVAGWGASNGIMVRSGGSMGLYYDQIFSLVEFLVLAFLSMAAVGFYVFGMNRIYLEQEKSSQYHSQIAVYKMLSEQYRQSERLRHDMKNHIIALSALSRNKEWEKIDSYLKTMESIALDADGDMTGNKAVDALLYQKRKRAEEENIKWECDVQMPKEYCINEFDLCVLFGNILDNALEACGRMQRGECRFINIQAKTVKKCFLLEVKNSMDITEKCTDGFTDKGDSQKHGIGLLNVSDVVDKHNGVVNTEAEKGIFVISILMPFSDAADRGAIVDKSVLSRKSHGFP